MLGRPKEIDFESKHILEEIDLALKIFGVKPDLDSLDRILKHDDFVWSLNDKSWNELR